MELPFNHRPGRRERHLRRIHENPLFAWPPRRIAPEELLAAQKSDHEEMEAFGESLRALVQRAVDLPPDAGSEPLLELKESLERRYEQSFGLPEDHRRERSAILRLIGLIMQALERVAAKDPLARRELADEAQAREIHFRLLEQPLAADLLHPESSIAPDELLPSLLSASPSEVEAALGLFETPQVEQLATQAVQRLEQLDAQGLDLTEPRRRTLLILAKLGLDGPSLH